MSQITQTLAGTGVQTGDVAAGVPTAPELTAAEVAAAGSRWPLALAIGMLFLGALPDGMVAPLLDNLLVQRYGASVAASHWFMAVNLIGAVAIVPVLAVLRRKLPPSVLLAGAAVANGVLLAVLALPIGFAATLSVRVLEGAADLAMLAVIFDLLGKAGGARRCGARFGAAGTILLLGVAVGLATGGVVGSFEPAMVFILGALACFIVGAVAIVKHASFDGLVRSCPVVSDVGRVMQRQSRLWPALAMAAGDRALAGLCATTLVFYFAQVLDFQPHVRGMLIGSSLLMLALGTFPAGLLADRFGHVRLRIVASAAYVSCLAMVPLLAPAGVGTAMMVMICFGLAGSALMPTSIALACGSGRGSVAMGAYHACGNVGHQLLGIGGAALLIAWLSGPSGPDASAYHTIIYSFAIGYAALNILAMTALRR